KDFAGVTQVITAPVVAIAPLDLPVKTLQDFIDLAKQKPGTLNFGSAGVASTTYLATEVFRQQAKIDIVHVPFRGAPEAVNAALRGDVQIYFAPLPNSLELSQANKGRALAVNTSQRVKQWPDLPTVAEAGVPSYKYDSWFAVMAPAGTPKPILNKVSQDIATVLKMPDVIEILEKQGSIPVTNTPDEFDVILKNDTE